MAKHFHATTRYEPAQGLAMILGLALMALDAWGSFESIYKSEAAITYLTLAAPCVAVAACALPVFLARAWGTGHYSKAAVLFAAFLAAGAVVVMSALERTGAAQDRTVTARQSENQRVALARAGVATAETALADARATAKAECDSGRGPRCRAAEQRVEAAVRTVSTAQSALAQAGVEVAADPRAKTLATLLPFLSEATIGLYAPVVLPVAMLVAGFALILYGVPHGGRRGPEKARPRKRARRKAPRPRPPSTEQASADVIPFRAANDH